VTLAFVNREKGPQRLGGGRFTKLIYVGGAVFWNCIFSRENDANCDKTRLRTQFMGQLW